MSFWKQSGCRSRFISPFIRSPHVVDIGDVSIGGNPIATSLVQTAQAQVTAAKARDRERVLSERSRRYMDLVDLRVADLESTETVRRLPANESGQAEAEHQAEGRRPGSVADDDERPRIDVRA